MRYLAVLFFCLSACTAAQIQQTLGDIDGVLSTGQLSEGEVASGLKDALIQGVRTGSEKAGEYGGFLNRPQIRIPFPPEVSKVETRLRQIGLDNEVDRFIESMNHGAEKAASLAVPIFEKAVREMTIEDAWDILRGPDNAATRYLQEKTSAPLFEAFSPVVGESLDQVNATKYYGDIIGVYNKIPLVEKVDPDLQDYVTNKAMEGLFYLVAEEEKKIREDPLARTTELMKKVFAAQD